MGSLVPSLDSRMHGNDGAVSSAPKKRGPRARPVNPSFPRRRESSGCNEYPAAVHGAPGWRYNPVIPVNSGNPAREARDYSGFLLSQERRSLRRNDGRQTELKHCPSPVSLDLC
jgi:hypothetical protein